MTDSSQTFYLDQETADLLTQLVPEEKQRSAYVSKLIHAAAHMTEEIEPADGSAGLLYARMSEESLAQDWSSPEEDAAWRDLRVVM